MGYHHNSKRDKDKSSNPWSWNHLESFKKTENLIEIDESSLSPEKLRAVVNQPLAIVYETRYVRVSKHPKSPRLSSVHLSIIPQVKRSSTSIHFEISYLNSNLKAVCNHEIDSKKSKSLLLHIPLRVNHLIHLNFHWVNHLHLHQFIVIKWYESYLHSNVTNCHFSS